MKISAVSAALLVAVACAAAAQQPAPSASTASSAAPPAARAAPPTCDAPVHRQFDFWIGEWTVTSGGQHAGDSRIERLLQGCAILENWRGAGGREGKSLNFYDRRHGVWHQTWMSDNGNALQLDGEFANGKMRLTGRKVDPATKAETHERITWTPLPGGDVQQLWESSPDGKTWTVQFDGLYKRK